MDMGDIAQRLQATKGLMPLPKTQIDLSAGILEQIRAGEMRVI